jgi:hypothetical protein
LIIHSWTKPEALLENKFGSAVTSALSCSTSPSAVRPSPLTTAPVPFHKKARSSRAALNCRMIGGLSAYGSATVVPLRLRSSRPSACASLSRSLNRRPKPWAGQLFEHHKQTKIKEIQADAELF